MGKRVFKADTVKGIVPKIIDKLLKTRNSIKAELRKSTISDSSRRLFEIKNSAIKQVCAIIYGCLGSTYDGNCVAAPEIAAMITAVGREIWTSLKVHLQRKNHQIIHGVTDGFIIYTEFAKNVAGDLIEFAESCPYRCIPEIREELLGVYTKDKNCWIGMDTNGKLINKNVIESSSCEIQIRIELALFKILLMRVPSNSTISNMFVELQETLLIWSNHIDPTIHSNYFKFYVAKSPIFSPLTYPIRYSLSLSSSIKTMCALSTSTGKLSDLQSNMIDKILKAYIPI
jgi:hypothetical protein